VEPEELVEKWEAGTLSFEDVEIVSASVVAGNGSTPGLPAVIDDMTPGQFQELCRQHRAAFLLGKTPDQILQWAASLPERDWMDWFIRLSPKEHHIKGQYQVQSLVAQLGPLKKGG